MEKKLLAVVAAVLVLAGCSAAPSDDGADSARVAPSSSPTPTVAPEPIAGESSAPTEPLSADERILEALGGLTVKEYMERVFADGAWHGTMPTGDQLESAAQVACQQLTDGVPKEDVVAVTGANADPANEDADWNNVQLVTASTQVVCPDFFD